MRSQTGRIVVRVIGVLLAAGAAIVSYELLQMHARPAQAATTTRPARNEMSWADEVCTTIVEHADCEAAVKSRWGTIPYIGVPTAQLGLYYYTALFWWFLLIGPVGYNQRGLHLLATAFVAVGLGFSIFMFMQMKQLPQMCGLCLLTHVLNAGLFMCMLLLWPRAPRVTPLAIDPHGERLFPESTQRAAIATEEWPSGYALLVLPLVILLSFMVETPQFLYAGEVQQLNERQLQLQQVALAARDKEIAAQKEVETYKKLARGNKATEDVDRLQDQVRQLESDAQMSQNQYERRIKSLEDETKSLSDQLETVRKAAEGKSDAKELVEIQKKQQTAEGMKSYWEAQYRRYDNRWQHTYLGWELSPPLTISTANSPTRGNPNAQHSVVIFSDFQCPTCKGFDQWFNTKIMAMAAQFGGFKVTFKYWPISTKCNAFATRDLHPAACDAAMAAQAAFLLGGNDAFWKMNDLLFADQDVWKTTANFDAYAQRIGLNLDAFHETMKKPEVMQKIKQDIAEGDALGKNFFDQGLITKEDLDAIKVNSTPSIYVDNKRLTSVQHWQTWRAILMNPTPQWAPERRLGTTRPAGAPASQPAISR